MFARQHKNGINASASASPKPAKADSFVDPLDALRHKAFRPLTPLSQALFCPLRPTPSQMGLAFLALLGFNRGRVPPSGGSLEIGNSVLPPKSAPVPPSRSPFGGIPRNWKPRNTARRNRRRRSSSPFGGIPGNWKHLPESLLATSSSPPFGGKRKWGKTSPSGIG